MWFEKIYNVTLNIRDPNTYCTQPRAAIEHLLARGYVGRCFGGAYIVKILDISRYSDCRIKTTDLSAEGYVDVEFRALVSVVAQWDVVAGVKILERVPLVIGRSETEAPVVVNLLPGEEVEAVKKDQIVSVRVVRALYPPDNPIATVQGVLFTCDKSAPAYRLTADLSARDAAELAPLVARIKSLLVQRAELMEARRDDVLFFEALVYSYVRPEIDAPQTIRTSGAADWEGPAGYPLAAGRTPVNLLEIVERASGGSAKTRGIWTRDLAIYRSSPLASVGDTAAGTAADVKAQQPGIAFTQMLKTMEVFLTAINEMTAVYDTPELIESHKNVWLAMRKAHLPRPAE